jgi:hypothetical protein
VDQLTTDAKLAGVLTDVGPIRYKLKDDIHFSLQFLKINVTSKMYEQLRADPSNNIPTMLALPLIWACQEPSLTHMIHPQVLSRVNQGYNSIRGQHVITYNLVHISCLEDRVFIQDAVAMGEGEGEAIGGSQAVITATYSSPARSRPSFFQTTCWSNSSQKTSSNSNNTRVSCVATQQLSSIRFIPI